MVRTNYFVQVGFTALMAIPRLLHLILHFEYVLNRLFRTEQTGVFAFRFILMNRRFVEREISLPDLR